MGDEGDDDEIVRRGSRIWEIRSPSSGQVPSLNGSPSTPKSRHSIVEQGVLDTFNLANHFTIVSKRFYTLSYGSAGIPKLLMYDLEKLCRWGGLFTCLVKGTVLTVDSGLLRLILMQLCTCGAICAMAVLVMPIDISTVNPEGLSELTNYLNKFVPFVLGLYLALTISRWWALRVSALGTLFDSVANTVQIVACQLNADTQCHVRAAVARWGMTSILLVVRAAREQTKIDDLVAKGVLTKDEEIILRDISPYGKAMSLWSWIMRICQENFKDAAGPPPHSIQLLQIFKICLAARDGIQTINTYLQTQVPFSYVHLISLLVFLNNGILCMNCSAEVLVAIWGSDEPHWMRAFFQVVKLVLIPVLYQGLLGISYLILDPFGEDLLDFPMAAYTKYTSEACNAAFLAQHNCQSGPAPATPKPSPQPAPKEPLTQPMATMDPSALAKSLDQFCDLLECLPRVASEITALHEMAKMSKSRCEEDSRNLQNALNMYAQMVGK